MTPEEEKNHLLGVLNPLHTDERDDDSAVISESIGQVVQRYIYGEMIFERHEIRALLLRLIDVEDKVVEIQSVLGREAELMTTAGWVRGAETPPT